MLRVLSSGAIRKELCYNTGLLQSSQIRNNGMTLKE